MPHLILSLSKDERAVRISPHRPYLPAAISRPMTSFWISLVPS